jgi:hypothetical protein
MLIEVDMRKLSAYLQMCTDVIVDYLLTAATLLDVIAFMVSFLVKSKYRQLS